MFKREFSRKNYLKGNDFRDICGVAQRYYEFPEVQRVGAPDTAHIRRISRLADHLRKKNYFYNNIIILKKRRRKITFENLSSYWLFQFIFLYIYNAIRTSRSLRSSCNIFFRRRTALPIRNKNGSASTFCSNQSTSQSPN